MIGLVKNKLNNKFVVISAVTDRKEGYVQRKFQRGLDAMAAWCKRLNIKSMKTRLGRSTSLIEIDRLILFLRWMDGISNL
jgi:hypothetical protein